MKHVTHFATLLAALSLMAASTSCSSMLTALSESISQINDQLASNLSENPQSTQPQATAKAASATTATASASAAKPTPSSEFAGTPYTVLPAGTDGSIGKSGK